MEKVKLALTIFQFCFPRKKHCDEQKTNFVLQFQKEPFYFSKVKNRYLITSKKLMLKSRFGKKSEKVVLDKSSNPATLLIG